MKKAVFRLYGLKDATIDGGGSTFVFHGNAFPFVVQDCDGVKIGNFTSRVHRLPLVEFTITEKNDEGFLFRFAEERCSSATSKTPTRRTPGNVWSKK